MKFPVSILRSSEAQIFRSNPWKSAALRTPHSALRTRLAFTMIEVAICLAIIGFALVAIIGILPRGMNMQRDIREENIIARDATVLLEAVRSGARGADHLTNFVYAITVTNYAAATGMSYTRADFLTNGANIIGLMSTPGDTGYRAIAYVRSMSGLATEKPPQDNATVRDDSFSYRVVCVNAPVAGVPGDGQLAANQRELRMTFLWPLLPNGNTGPGKQTFRATIAGQLSQDSTNGLLYFYQPQTFIKQ